LSVKIYYMLNNFKAKKISGDRIYLKELTLVYITEEYCNWINDPEVNKYLETRKITMRELREYVKNQINDPNSIFFGIFDVENNKHIGNLKLSAIDWKEKKVVFSMVIGNKEYWGKGIGTEATKLAIDFSLNFLNMDRIELGVIKEHEVAKKIYKKLGFKTIRIDKNFYNHDGVWCDRVYMVFKK